jgi:hypothetical protein
LRNFEEWRWILKPKDLQGFENLEGLGCRTTIFVVHFWGQLGKLSYVFLGTTW